MKDTWPYLTAEFWSGSVITKTIPVLEMHRHLRLSKGPVNQKDLVVVCWDRGVTNLPRGNKMSIYVEVSVRNKRRSVFHPMADGEEPSYPRILHLLDAGNVLFRVVLPLNSNPRSTQISSPHGNSSIVSLPGNVTWCVLTECSNRTVRRRLFLHFGG